MLTPPRDAVTGSAQIPNTGTVPSRLWAESDYRHSRPTDRIPAGTPGIRTGEHVFEYNRIRIPPACRPPKECAVAHLSIDPPWAGSPPGAGPLLLQRRAARARENACKRRPGRSPDPLSCARDFKPPHPHPTAHRSRPNAIPHANPHPRKSPAGHSARRPCGRAAVPHWGRPVAVAKRRSPVSAEPRFHLRDRRFVARLRPTVASARAPAAQEGRANGSTYWNAGLPRRSA